MSRPHLHKEAYCLMVYEDLETHRREVLWNSRDGVTPFCITSLDGNEARHTDWGRDRYAPDHIPIVGSRVFVDLTMERAMQHRQAYVEAWWDKSVHGCRMSDSFPSKTAAIELLAQGDMEQRGQPDIIEVTPEWLDAMLAARQTAQLQTANREKIQDALRDGPVPFLIPDLKNR